MRLYVLCAITGPPNVDFDELVCVVCNAGPPNVDFGEFGCVVCNYRPSECGL